MISIIDEAKKKHMPIKIVKFSNINTKRVSGLQKEL